MKNKKKYITLGDDGCDFRQMSKIMKKSGYILNHASSRNILMSALDQLLIKIGNSLNANLSLETIKDLKNNQEFHDILSDVLYVAYQQIVEENKNRLNDNEQQ